MQETEAAVPSWSVLLLGAGWRKMAVTFWGRRSSFLFLSMVVGVVWEDMRQVCRL